MAAVRCSMKWRHPPWSRHHIRPRAAIYQLPTDRQVAPSTGVMLKQKNHKGTSHLVVKFQPLCCWWLIWPIHNDAKNLKRMTETLAYGYSSDSTQRELSNEYQHDRVQMVFENLSVIVIWMKVALALEGLSCRYQHCIQYGVPLYWHNAETKNIMVASSCHNFNLSGQKKCLVLMTS